MASKGRGGLEVEVVRALWAPLHQRDVDLLCGAEHLRRALRPLRRPRGLRRGRGLAARGLLLGTLLLLAIFMVCWIKTSLKGFYLSLVCHF